MANSSLAYTSSINVKNISRSVSSLKQGVENSQRSANGILSTLETRSKFKRQALTNNARLFQRRRDAVQRKDREDIVEASTISGPLNRTRKVISSSTKGFLGRILDFVGTLMVAWLVNNLPTIISLGQQLTVRIKTVTKVMSNFVRDTTDLLSGFGQLLQAVYQNLTNFDFIDSQRRIATAMNRMEVSFLNIQSQLKEAFSILTQPFDLEKPPEEQPPGAPPDVPTTPSGGEKFKPLLDLISSGESAGGGYSAMYPGESYPQILNMSIAEVIQFQKQKLKDGRKSAAIGRYQMLYPESYAKAAGLPLTAKFSPENQDKMVIAYLRKNRRLSEWEQGKISDETLSEELAREFGAFRSASGYVLPENTGSIGFNKLKPVLQKIKSTPAPPATPGGLGSRKLVSGDILTQSIGRGVRDIRITDSYKDPSRPSHLGLDIACPSGTWIALRVDCEWVGYAFDSGGYGHVLDVWIPSYGIQLRFGHLLDKPKTFTKMKAGTSFAQCGSSGNSSGPHIHLEYTTTKGRRAGGSDGDPSPYVPLLLLTNKPNTGSFSVPGKTALAPAPPAQITTPPKQQQDLKQQPRDNIIAVPIPQQSQKQTVPYATSGGEQTTSTYLTEQSALNRLIKNRLLLELAYT